MPAKLAAYLMRGIVRPATEEIHVAVYPGWNYTWDYMSQVTYPRASDVAALGKLGFVNTASGQHFLTTVATSWTMANFTGPSGTYYAVAWRASDGLVLSAYEIGNPVGKVSAQNMVRLYDVGLSEGRATILGPLLDTKTGGVPTGNTKRGELLFIGGFIQWGTVAWAVMLLDNTWNGGSNPDPISREVKFLSDIPFSAWVMPAVGLSGNVVSESGGAYANNVQFPAHPAGRTIKHAAIFVNTGNPATSEVARIITLDLAGAPMVTNGVDPIWLDFRGRPVLFFGAGLPPSAIKTTSPTPIKISG